MSTIEPSSQDDIQWRPVSKDTGFEGGSLARARPYGTDYGTGMVLNIADFSRGRVVRTYRFSYRYLPAT